MIAKLTTTCDEIYKFSENLWKTVQKADKMKKKDTYLHGKSITCIQYGMN